MKPDSYSDTLAEMFKLGRFGIKLELDTIRQILTALGNPQNQFNSIHIAGTNGKGSVAAMLSTILHLAGYKVGRYTSPHLETFNERICIDNRPIDDDDVVSLYQAVSAVHPDTRQPTFFELATAMALLQFGRKKVDWAIIETGMGGRMDATNLLAPALTVITNISLEHKAYLGNTIAAIAGEKAGIIKARTPVVTAVQQPSARRVIADKAAELDAPVYLKGRDFKTRSHGDGTFSYYGLHQRLGHCALGLQGRHQIDNAAQVLAACELLTRAGWATPDESHIRAGLAQAQWPGRLEVAATHPHIILDGAHNLMAARVLADYLKSRFDKAQVTMVAGILDDKPYRRILQILAEASGRIIVTRPTINRALKTDVLETEARRLWPEVRVAPSVDRAVQMAVDNYSGPDEVICVAGSLYVVGEAKTALAGMKLG